MTRASVRALECMICKIRVPISGGRRPGKKFRLSGARFMICRRDRIRHPIPPLLRLRLGHPSVGDCQMTANTLKITCPKYKKGRGAGPGPAI
jgi:hypothetical protein